VLCFKSDLAYPRFNNFIFKIMQLHYCRTEVKAEQQVCHRAKTAEFRKGNGSIEKLMTPFISSDRHTTIHFNNSTIKSAKEY